MISRVLNYISVLIVCLVALLLSTGAAIAQTNQLTGQIIMPAGVTPASSNAVFRIETVPLDTFQINGNTVQSSDTVTIPVFNSSANYAIPLKDVTGNGNPNRKLKFECLSGCGNIAITTIGYWGGASGIVSEADAQEFFSGIGQTINLNLERADLFSGVIALPEGIVASGNETFNVTVIGRLLDNSRPVFTQTVTTQQGQDRWAFFVGVPRNSTSSKWNLRLSCSGCDESIPGGPYFASTSRGDPLMFSAAGEFFFDKNRSYGNIALTLPEPPAEPEPPEPPEPPTPISIVPVTTLLLDE